MMNINELQNRMNWNLNQKIDHILGTIERFINLYPYSFVSFSGGLDSTVMLFLIRIIKKDIIAKFVNTTNEHSEIIRFVKNIDNIDIINPEMTFKATIEQYGFPLISKKTARMIGDVKNPTETNKNSRNLYLNGIKKDGSKSNQFIIPKKYRYLIDEPFNITYKCCNILKKKPLSKFQKQGTFIGTLIEDSANRKMSYIKTGCINENKNSCMPISILTREEIWTIIKQNKISYCDIYNKGENHTGCAYCGFGIVYDKDRFVRLKNREPKRFDHVMNYQNNGIKYKEAIELVLSKI